MSELANDQPTMTNAERIGSAAILSRLDELRALLGSVADELDANQREYEELTKRYKSLSFEHERLSRKLAGYDELELEPVE